MTKSSRNNYERIEPEVADLFKELVETVRPLFRKDDDEGTINKAFQFAYEAHKGVKRKAGEPYITHPLSVALIVAKEIGLGVRSVVAALLHDVVEDTEYTLEDIEHRFGSKTASMVDGLTKLGGVFDRDISEQAENFKKMLLTLSDDARVIIIKIADRLHNMRTLGAMPQHKQMKIASETIYLFAPLAHRLGLYLIKVELENLSLKYRFPDEYNAIADKLARTESERTEFMNKFIDPIREKLEESEIQSEITGRVKNIYSIWKKMKSKNLSFEEIYDLCAIRIIFKPTLLIPEKSQCWHVYSLITDIYKPYPDRIRDWVNIPKANGYEALHATLMSKEGVWVEVQIRSERMDHVAEHGLASHWRYKNPNINNTENEFDKILEQLREALTNPTEDAIDFLDNFKLNLHVSDIVVFTPKGESRNMPKGATVLDFAYAIHSKIGDTALGAKVNYRLTPLSEKLKTGDQIEIITSPTVHPKVEWLTMVVTAKAINYIKSYLKRDNENTIQIGQQILENELKRLGITTSKYGQALQKLMPATDCINKDQFYSKLGTGIVKVDIIESILKENVATKLVKYWTLKLFTQPFKSITSTNKSEEVISEEKFIVAKCCHPIPGDKIMGFKMDEEHIEVHKTSCSAAVKLAVQHGEKIVTPEWSTEKIISYLAVIEIKGIDRVGILLDMSTVISGELDVNIRELDFKTFDGVFIGKINLYVKNHDDLNKLMGKVGRIKGIESVSRVETGLKQL